MKRLAMPLLAVAALSFGAANAQETAETSLSEAELKLAHEAELSDLQRKLDVASMRFMIASEIAKIAEEEAKTAIAQAEGAEHKKIKTDADVNSRQSTPSRISLMTANLRPKGGGPLCEAKWFVAYHCNGRPECAVEMEASACGGASARQAMDMTVEYMCGKPEDEGFETRKGEFSFQGLGSMSTAFLTCY